MRRSERCRARETKAGKREEGRGKRTDHTAAIGLRCSAPARSCTLPASRFPLPSTVALSGRTDAHEVAIPERAFDAAYIGPDLVLPSRAGRKSGALAGVGPVPRVSRNF